MRPHTKEALFAAAVIDTLQPELREYIRDMIVRVAGVPAELVIDPPPEPSEEEPPTSGQLH